MRQPSRIDWVEVGGWVVIIAASSLVGLLVYGLANHTDAQTPPPPTAELEISIEDMERIASMFAGEAKRIKDARMDALEKRVEKLEEGNNE